MTELHHTVSGLQYTLPVTVCKLPALNHYRCAHIHRYLNLLTNLLFSLVFGTHSVHILLVLYIAILSFEFDIVLVINIIPSLSYSVHIVVNYHRDKKDEISIAKRTV